MLAAAVSRQARRGTRGVPEARMPVHVVGEVLATRRAGAYRVLTLAVPGIPERLRPGMFVAVSVDHHLARRPLWVLRVRDGGAHGPTIDVVVEPRGVGTRWLAGRPVGSRLAVTGPLGRPFSLPVEPVPCLLVGEGYAAAPMFGLAERLRERECAVTLLVGGSDEQHLLSALEARRLASTVLVVTDDGSVGARGSVADRLEQALDSSDAAVVYGAGRTTTLEQVAAAAARRGLRSQVAPERPMPCGTGLCQACVLPVTTPAGEDRTVRSCVEGPALRGDLVRWGDLS